MGSDHIIDGAAPSDALVRRKVLRGGIVATLISLLAKQGMAAPPAGEVRDVASSDNTVPRSSQMLSDLKSADDLLNSYAVSQLILRERLARELHDFDAEEACFLPDALVEVSWYKGDAAGFVDAGRKSDEGDNPSKAVYFDTMSPAAVWVNHERAIADSSCVVNTFLLLDGTEASMKSYTRLLWRAQKINGEWRIAGLRAIYIRDTLEPCNPAEIPRIDKQKLEQYRPSYRHLSYVLEVQGRSLRDDLPGVDRPETVAALRAAERRWLE